MYAQKCYTINDQWTEKIVWGKPWVGRGWVEGGKEGKKWETSVMLSTTKD